MSDIIRALATLCTFVFVVMALAILADVIASAEGI